MDIDSILSKFLEQSIIVSSWGISNIVISDQSICFDVNGFKYKGKVKISPSQNESICVSLLDADKVIQTNLFSIVKTIDDVIEKTELYDLAVLNTL